MEGCPILIQISKYLESIAKALFLSLDRISFCRFDKSGSCIKTLSKPPEERMFHPLHQHRCEKLLTGFSFDTTDSFLIPLSEQSQILTTRRSNIFSFLFASAVAALSYPLSILIKHLISSENHLRLLGDVPRVLDVTQGTADLVSSPWLWFFRRRYRSA